MLLRVIGWRNYGILVRGGGISGAEILSARLFGRGNVE